MNASPLVQTEPSGKAKAPAARVQVAEPFTVVIFGITGALAGGKLLPALFSLWRNDYFPHSFVIVGVGRREKSDAQLRADLREAAQAHGGLPAELGEAWDRFAASLFYHRADFAVAEGYPALAGRLQALEKERGLTGNRLYYLATDPEAFPVIVEQLADAKLLHREPGLPWTRVVIEKPFGKDLASARTLDQHILRFLREEQIYRIDHYLGKETVQNLLSFRFGNAIFEPVFNRRYVDHVQITMAESVGMEGPRAFYDRAGALRDVVQNHLLQLLAFVAMEPPITLAAKEIRDEKVKVLDSLSPGDPGDINRWVVRGQYGAGHMDGEPVRGYREEEGVPDGSTTETYVALRLGVETWRWAGVPFLLRAGKRLAERETEIVVGFKRPPLRLFTRVPRDGDLGDRTCQCMDVCKCAIAQVEPSTLVFRIQPDEGISLSVSAKRPGMQLALQPVRMDFRYDESFRQAMPKAYERLLLDALRGDSTLFMRSEEVMAAWGFVTPILEAWHQQPSPRFPNYAAGSWGPAEADGLKDGCQRGWRQP